MQIAQVTLAGTIYTIRQLPIKANRNWRRKYDRLVKMTLGAIWAMGKLTEQKVESPERVMETVGAAMLGRVGKLSETLIRSMDTILNALYAYSPELRADRQNIEACAYDDEVVVAFRALLTLAYPFGQAKEPEQIAGMDKNIEAITTSLQQKAAEIKAHSTHINDIHPGQRIGAYSVVSPETLMKRIRSN